MSPRHGTVRVDLSLEQARALQELAARQSGPAGEAAPLLAAAIPPPKAAPKPGDPFECPNCGGTDWTADYYQAVRQGIALVVGADGAPAAEDWCGDEASYDDGDTKVEAYTCDGCHHEIKLGDFTFVPIDKEKLLMAMAPAVAGGPER